MAENPDEQNPNYRSDPERLERLFKELDKNQDESVSDENYQRLLFGPSQIIWKVVIPTCQAVSVFTILMTNYQILKTRMVTSKRYGIKLFGRGSENSNKAINTLFIIMFVQTLCKVPASVYSYVAVDDKIEGNRWFAFAAYFCLFLSSTVMPVIYFSRSLAFKRALVHIRRHPFARNAYLDYAAQHGLTHHRNGRVIILTSKKIKVHKMKRLKEDLKSVAAEETKETNFMSKSKSRLTPSSTAESFVAHLRKHSVAGDTMAVPSPSKDGRPKDTDSKSGGVVAGEKGLLNNQTSDLENEHDQNPQSYSEGISNERIKSEDEKDEGNVNGLSSSPTTARTEEDEDGESSREKYKIHRRSSAAAETETAPAEDVPTHRRDPVAVADDIPTHRRNYVAAPDDVSTHRRDSVADPDDVSTHRRDSVAARDDEPTHRGDSVAAPDDVPTHRRDSVAVPDDVPTHRRDSVAAPDDVPIYRRNYVAAPDDVSTHRRDSVAARDDEPTHRGDSVAAPDDVPTHRRDPVAVPDDVPTQRRDSVAAPDDVPTHRRDSVAAPDDVPIHRRDSVAATDDLPTHRRDSVAAPDDVPTHRRDSDAAPDDVPIHFRDSVAVPDDDDVSTHVRDSVAATDDAPTR
ncbi:hypothetical protein QZH41_006476 [Actinostola sp. cb2023]|nr:hypothetical protein QZH41_006476 [Actinostola sp. cb2023]